jgi:hypothetical protein
MSTTHINEPTEQNGKKVAIQLGGEVLLRDYFAAKAMQALLSNVEAGNEHQVVLIPNIAYELADDMLRERKV